MTNTPRTDAALLSSRGTAFIDLARELERERAELLHAVYVAKGAFARQLTDGMAPDWWGDDEHEAYQALKAAIAKAEGHE